MLGRTISHYRIEEKLGEGGMGVVYRAQDLSLNRPVAIKFLSSQVAGEERRRRFQQEAQTASSLNHPHILTVYEAGTHEGQQYLVTEFIDGGSLRDWARRTQPALRQIVDLLAGVADGLACAHEAGIVHRDIKPENILVSKNGYAKLVDFGLAKVLDAETSSDSEARTVSAGPTRPGVIMGTVAYMSPEQAEGKKVDARSDIFAFGVVLYELAAGERPFIGKTDIDLLHAILHSAPQPLAGVAPELRIAVEKALEKDPADRYQHMREMVVDLKRLQRMKPSETAEGPAQPRARRRRWWIPAAVAAVLLLAAAVTAWRLRQSDFFWKNPLEGAQFTRLTDFEGVERDAAISPDGKFVVFLADRDGPYDAWVTQVGSGEFVNLTKGRFPQLLQESVRCAGFSADAAQVWLRQATLGQVGGILVMPTLGGTPRPFLDRAGGVAWSPDGNRIAYFEGRDGDPIFVADRKGGNPTQILSGQLGDHRHFPTWSPDGRFIYFVKGIPHSRDTDIWRIRPEGGEPERITHHKSDLKYPTLLDNRTLLYTATAEDGSGPWLYAADVERRVSRRVSVGLVQYTSVAATADGRRLVVSEANPTANLWTVPISDQTVDESAARRVALPTMRAVRPVYGPDYFLYLSSKGGADGLWKFQNGAATELWKGVDGALVAAASLSRDGSQIAFSVQQQGRMRLHVMTASGTGVRPLAPALDVRGSPSWSPDGNSILVGAQEGNDTKLFRVPLDGGPPARLLDEISSDPLFSPDGRLIAYGGPTAAGVIPIKLMTAQKAPVALPDLRLRVGGNRLRFLPDGKALVIMRGDDRQPNFWLVDLATGRERQLTDLQPGYSMRSFDISPDGKQILFDRARENSDIVMIDLARR